MKYFLNCPGMDHRITKMNHDPDLVIEWTSDVIPPVIVCLEEKFNFKIGTVNDYYRLLSKISKEEQEWLIFEHDGEISMYAPAKKRRLIFKDKLVKMKFMLKYSS